MGSPPRSSPATPGRRLQRLELRVPLSLAATGTRLGPVIAAALAALALQVTGVVTGIEDALGTMGFDPDRSLLIAALVTDALVATAAVVPRGRSRLGIAAGVVAFGGIFRSTFLRETSTALSPAPGQGHFDAGGWLTTVFVLITIAILCGAIADVLAGSVRASFVEAAARVRSVVRGGTPKRSLIRPAAVFAALAITIVAAPIFGDMVNYEPDVRLTAGAPAPVGLVGGNVAGPTLPPTAASDPFLEPAVLAGGDARTPIDPGRPWLAWRPSGTGRIAEYQLPGPWTGGTSSTASIWVYTPPGYPTGTRRLPVIYEVPWGVISFLRGADIQGALDSLTTSGTIPASIVVFVSELGGPYPDSECINSADGREWFERFMTATVVPFIDSRYLTIARPSARALMGFSYGGYCAAMLMLRHPDLFASSVSFSGYFQAALRSGETPNAWRPYGGNQALITATSPIDEAAAVPARLRPSLFVELSGSPTETFFGPQYQAFAAAVHRAGIALALFPTQLGHSWAAVRSELGSVLATLAARENALGVFAA